MLGAQDHVGFFNGRAGSEHDALAGGLGAGYRWPVWMHLRGGGDGLYYAWSTHAGVH